MTTEVTSTNQTKMRTTLKSKDAGLDAATPQVKALDQQVEKCRESGKATVSPEAGEDQLGAEQCLDAVDPEEVEHVSAASGKRAEPTEHARKDTRSRPITIWDRRQQYSRGESRHGIWSSTFKIQKQSAAAELGDATLVATVDGEVIGQGTLTDNMRTELESCFDSASAEAGFCRLNPGARPEMKVSVRKYRFWRSIKVRVKSQVKPDDSLSVEGNSSRLGADVPSELKDDPAQHPEAAGGDHEGQHAAPGEHVEAGDQDRQDVPHGGRAGDGGDEHPTINVATTPPAPDYGMAVHEVCDMFPLMPPDKLRRLADDILKNGQLQPILVHEGQIVDGRNRLLACRMAGVEPWIMEWREHYEGTMRLSRWIWSTNAERRHLTRDQIAMTHASMCLWEENEDAKRRRVQGQKRGGQTAGRSRAKADSLPMNSSASYAELDSAEPADPGEPERPAPSSQRSGSGDVRAKMAKDARVSEHVMQQAINVAKADPQLGKRVTAGEVPLREANRQVKAKTASVRQPRPKAARWKTGKLESKMPAPSAESGSELKHDAAEPSAVPNIDMGVTDGGPSAKYDSDGDDLDLAELAKAYNRNLAIDIIVRRAERVLKLTQTEAEFDAVMRAACDCIRGIPWV